MKKSLLFIIYIIKENKNKYAIRENIAKEKIALNATSY